MAGADLHLFNKQQTFWGKELHVAVLTIPGLRSTQVEALIERWQMFKRDRRMGERIVRLIGDFYSPRRSFTLRPAQNRENPFLWIRRDRFGGGKLILPRDFNVAFSSIVAAELQYELPTLQACIPATDGGTHLALAIVRERVRTEFGDLALRKFTRTFGAQRWQEDPTKGEPRLVADILHQNFLKTVECAIGFCRFDGYGAIPLKMWRIFLPLLDLWRSGNFPLGFDRHETHAVNAPDAHNQSVKAVMLCADPRPS